MEAVPGVRARSIGPAGMSGRVTAIEASVADPNVIYVGSASGGLWKSTSGGADWEPIFDDQPVASIGDVAIDPNAPDVLWVATGEGNPRNSVTAGDGVFKSLDGGRTWRRVGLEHTRHIHRIVVHPRDPNTVYAGATGAAWGENPERGVYRTTDGGASWTKSLYVNEKTGCADLAMDPRNPNKLFAAMWEHRRYPWFFNSGGEGSGLYMTHDGGESWTRLDETNGLPKAPLGRIGVAIAPSDPNVVYALVEAEKNGLYRSDDGGASWRLVASGNIGNRPFYYAEIHVDPKNENRVYNLYSKVDVSVDGGKTFETLIDYSEAHPDHHAWWIHPEDPDFIIDGNDGGLAISRDRGETWRYARNLPLGQFYHISIDDQTPYKIYGGLQDNGSWTGPSWLPRRGGLRSGDWSLISFGDGFDVAPNPANPRYGYSMWQGGNLLRYDLESGARRYVQPVHPEGVELRFNWNAAISTDPHNPDGVYFGSQFVHYSSDGGATWEILSPDLTTNDPEKQRQEESGGLTYDVTTAENHTTITTLAPSALDPNVVWAGTDDGAAQVTTDGGATWRNTIENVPDLPANSWIAQIRASRYDPAASFLVANNYRMNDWGLYVFYTDDLGESWRRVAREEDVEGYALSILQDPVELRLLFLGTEFGLYVSIDRGATWAKWTNGYPTVSTMDLAMQERTGDLVIGTFGRSLYIIENVTPLRELAAGVVEEEALVVFPIRDETMWNIADIQGVMYHGDAEFVGENRPFGALVYYYASFDTLAPDDGLSEETTDAKEKTREATVTIFDADGDTTRVLNTTAKNGVNRFVWDFRADGVRFPEQAKPKKPGAPPAGLQAAPGTYLVKVAIENSKDTATVTLSSDPRVDFPTAAIRARIEEAERLYRAIETATAAADQIRDAQKTVELATALAKERGGERADSLAKLASAESDTLQALLELFTQSETKGIKRDPNRVESLLHSTFYYLESAQSAPTETYEAKKRLALEKTRAAVEASNDYFAHGWMEFRREIEAAELSPFGDVRRIETSVFDK